jgi:two-component system phosphate regulon response regulator PhoB
MFFKCGEFMSKLLHVLVVDDEDALRQLLRYNLEKMGFAVTEAADGDKALEAVGAKAPDLMIVDWMMPGLSGPELCRRLRRKAETRNLPIIMLTARGEESDRIRSLDMGADLHMQKPFSLTELQAQVRALLRRGTAAVQETDAENVIRYADIVIDKNTRRVRRGTREVNLGPREFALFAKMLETPGRVYSRTQLLDMIWGEDRDVDERTVDVHIGRVRKMLTENGERDPIRTVRSAGYSVDETMAIPA